MVVFLGFVYVKQSAKSLGRVSETGMVDSVCTTSAQKYSLFVCVSPLLQITGFVLEARTLAPTPVYFEESFQLLLGTKLRSISVNLHRVIGYWYAAFSKPAG